MKRIIILLFFLASCSDKKMDNEKVCSYPEIPETHVKIFKDSVYIDSLITLVPITKTDTLSLIRLTYIDTTDVETQKSIFRLKRIRALINNRPRYIKFWFTSIVGNTDSTKDFGLFQVLTKDEAMEIIRFKFNKANKIISVVPSPIASANNSQTFNTWLADTLMRHYNE